MIIREIMVSDYDKVDNLMQQIHNMHVVNRPDLFVEIKHPYSSSELEELIADDNVVSVLAECDGVILGICIVAIRNKSGMVEKKIAYIEDLCVDESVRGQGIGKKLFSFVSSEAKKKGAERLDLMVWSFNKRALSFYEELGMQPQGYILEKEL